MKIKHLLSIKDLSVNEIENLLKEANNFLNKNKIQNRKCGNRYQSIKNQ